MTRRGYTLRRERCVWRDATFPPYGPAPACKAAQTLSVPWKWSSAASATDGCLRRVQSLAMFLEHRPEFLTRSGPCRLSLWFHSLVG